ncbi:MAG: transporter substrate-binding domain-containing protein [Thermotogae bacterium]|nr:transporter substrate-binding domain-containing protein [Thermotogota bacterium]
MKKLFFILFIFLISFLYAENTEINFSENELNFIKNHPYIKVGVDPNFLPFEYIDSKGEYNGISKDYTDIITKKTGINFIIQKDLSWPETYDLAVKGEIDILPAVSETAERDKHFLFSDPYYFVKRVIVTKDTENSVGGIEDLNGTTVAVQKNSSHHSYLLGFPKINLSLYDSVEAALTAVANGSEKSYVGNLATTNYFIKSTGLTNLKFIAFEAEKQLGLRVAVRQDWPELVTIINKVFSSVSEEEKIEINNRWIIIDTKTDYWPLIRIFLIIAGIFLVGFMVSFYWIIFLKKEINIRRKTQAELVKAKTEAEEANNFKSKFMARMSHEIRTPLNAVTGIAYLLKKTDLTITQKMYTDRITQASTSMLTIINDILDISKIESGKIEIENISFDIDQVIQDVVNIISYKIEEQNINFKLFKDSSIPNWFIGDAKRIEQILLNLLNNAAKFTPEGEVSFETRLIAREKNIYHISFIVKDTGIGIPEENLKKLFLPFSQADVSISRRFGGTGLGLSIVKSLTEMMKGEINVYSTEGEGSTFIINLPLEIDSESEKAYKEKLSSDLFKDIKVLVLEKTGANINLIENYLRVFGMECELTTSQSGAISLLETSNGKFSKPFDLILIDYDTPEGGGFKFIDIIKFNPKIVKKPKTIMLLPTTREDLFDRLDENGVDIGIGKPIIPSILFNAVLEIFKIKAVNNTKKPYTLEENNFSDKKYTALIVEDNKTNQMIEKSILKQIGINSIAAGNGKEGIRLFRENQSKIDLILMDLHMPVMNGYEASSEIRKISGNVPIIAMTADVILGVKEKCEINGISHYISKPFDPDHFIKTVKDILSGKSILDVKSGINNMGGNEELYKEVINEYYNENKNLVNILNSQISDKNYKSASEIIHKIKSSSGSIGAKKIYDIAVIFQKALDNESNDIKIIYDDFAEYFRNLISDIENYLK